VRQTGRVGVLGAIELAFDPALRIGDLLIRWQTIGVTVALLAGLGAAAVLDARLSRGARGRAELRLDDLIYIVLGVVPGAVVGGRLLHGIAFWEAYSADPLRLLDASVGSLSLTGALLGGTLTGVYIARLIGAPVRLWADSAVVPLLLAMGLGKLAQLLGGSGQGAPFDGPWAVAFGSPGPWISPIPDIPAHPAQVYEGLWLLVGIPVVIGWVISRSPESGGTWVRLRAELGTSRLFSAMLMWFLLGRVLIGFTWRDELLVGPLNVEQAIALAILFGIGVGLRIRGRSIVTADITMAPREREDDRDS
jgi:phosphatidylglycerol:prolipoprotein diacylglycerol transferase